MDGPGVRAVFVVQKLIELAPQLEPDREEEEIGGYLCELYVLCTQGRMSIEASRRNLTAAWTRTPVTLRPIAFPTVRAMLLDGLAELVRRAPPRDIDALGALVGALYVAVRRGRVPLPKALAYSTEWDLCERNQRKHAAGAPS